MRRLVSELSFTIPVKIICNLYDEWIAGIRKEMDKAGFNHSSLTDQDCAIRWQSWQRRIVPVEKRKFVKASGFTCPVGLQRGLNDLDSAIVTGVELWPWQSKLIDKPSFEDGLYNDYRIVHFHLGVGLEKSGYVNRTDELLFAVVDSAAIYGIGVYRHGDWYELDVLDIIDANWPQLLKPVTLNVHDISNCPRTREEVKRLREARVVTMMRLKSGRIIYPLGGGAATDGTSIEAVSSADYWARFLRDAEQLVTGDVRDRVQRGLMAQKDYHIHLYATSNEISAVIEDSHKWILWKRS